MIVEVLPIARDEALEAADWYNRRRRGLGDEFLTAFHQALVRIQSDVESLPIVEEYVGPRDYRRLAMNRFPYDVVARRDGDPILVMAVSHHRRQPLYWLDRDSDS